MCVCVNLCHVAMMFSNQKAIFVHVCKCVYVCSCVFVCMLLYACLYLCMCRYVEA